MKNKRIQKVISLLLIISLVLALFTNNVFANETSEIKVWNGSTLEPKGEGNEKSPYLITNAEELAYVISTGGGDDKYYKLTADIYLNEIDKVDWTTGEGKGGYAPTPWYDSVEFRGHIDGNGHMVYGLYYNAGLTTSEMAEGWSKPVGLIPAVKNGSTTSVTALGVDYMFINAKSSASAFVFRVSF